MTLQTQREKHTHRASFLKDGCKRRLPEQPRVQDRERGCLPPTKPSSGRSSYLMGTCCLPASVSSSQLFKSMQQLYELELLSVWDP